MVGTIRTVGELWVVAALFSKWTFQQESGRQALNEYQSALWLACSSSKLTVPMNSLIPIILFCPRGEMMPNLLTISNFGRMFVTSKCICT